MDTSKIIKGVVNSGRYTVTAPIVKEDYGLYLQIEGVELPSTYEVDFSNSENSGTSVTMIGNSDGVLIPSQFISTGKDILAFLYHVGADYGRTVYKFRIPNKCRPDRTDDEPTPEEQSVIDQAISALNEAVAQTSQDVIDADASAQSAQGYAEQAEDARDTAQTYANNAQASATSASQSATASANSASASAQSASQSAQIKSDVQGMVSDAQGYAESASQSASASAQSASDAHGYTQSASASAQSASGYASNAQTSANTASAKAQDASTSAQTASAKATESAQSATNASQSAQTAEQAKTASQTAQGLAESARDSAQGYAEDAQGYAEDAQASAESISASASQIAQNTADILKAFPTDTASGAVASFSDGADDIPLKSLIVNINPVQDLSQGDPSPENICPISGWTGANVNVSSKNLCNAVQSNVLEYSSSYSSYILSNGTVTTSGDALMGFIVPVKPSTTYTYSFTKTTGNSLQARVRLFSGYPTSFSDNFISQPINTFVSQNATSASVTFKTTAMTRNVMVGMYVTGASVAISNFQVEFGSSPTSYEPYNGSAVPISWQSEAGTVYGGKLDVLSGKLYVGYGICKVKDLSWSLYNTAFYATKSDILHGVTKVDVRCDRYKTAPSASGLGSANVWPNKVILGNIATASVIYIKDTTYASASEFKTAQGEMDIVYPLATPLTIQLTPHEVNSLFGQNNIFADTGDTEVEYRADTKLYVERLTAPDSEDMIADANITSGQYFMVGNNLYKATANIASGASVIVGTNATRKSLSEALNEINA